jgi:hypothetical protein
VETAQQTEWVVLDSGAETYCPTERFRSDVGGGAIPMVTAPTLVTLLLAALGNPDGCYLAFSIDASGACTIQDRAGAIGVLRPSGDGLYDLGRLSRTFRDRNDPVAPTPSAT